MSRLLSAPGLAPGRRASNERNTTVARRQPKGVEAELSVRAEELERARDVGDRWFGEHGERIDPDGIVRIEVAVQHLSQEQRGADDRRGIR